MVLLLPWILLADEVLPGRKRMTVYREENRCDLKRLVVMFEINGNIKPDGPAITTGFTG